MAQLRIDRFHGGMSDLYIGGETHIGQYYKNLLIDRNGKPYQRPGRGLFGVGLLGTEFPVSFAGVPTIKAISPFVLSNVDLEEEYTNYYAFAQTALDLRFVRLQNSPTTGKVEHISAGEVGAIDASWDVVASEKGYPLKYSPIAPFDHFVRTNDHVYLGQGQFTGNTDNVRLSKIFLRDTGSDIVPSNLIRVGLPAPAISVTNVPAAGANTYLYVAHYERRYTTYTGEQYSDRGPTTQIEVEDIDSIDLIFGAVVEITADMTNIATSSGSDNYYGVNVAYVEIVLRVFRTLANGQDFREIYGYAPLSTFTFNAAGEAIVVDAASKKFRDVTSDTGVILGRPPPYTAGGELDSDQPDKDFRLMTLTDDNVAFYSKGDNRVYHSKQSAPDAVPVLFFKEFDTNTVALGSIRNYAVAFERYRCSRLEGSVDDLGRGTVDKRTISDEVGCVGSDALVEVDTDIYFASHDGLYRTDGFRVQKISSHLNKRYYKLVQTLSQERSIEARYDQIGRRVYFSFNNVVDPTSQLVRPAKTTTWVVDLNFPMEGDTSTITEYAYDDELTVDDRDTTGTNADDWGSYPSANMFIDGEHFQFDTQGYISKYSPDLATDTLTRFPFATQAVVWAWQSAALSFGMEGLTKWVTKATIFCKKLTNTLTIQPSSINDDKQEDPRRMRPVLISETDLGNPGGLFEFKRWFPARTLRCNYKQLRLSNDTPVKFGESSTPTDIGQTTVASSTRKNIQRIVTGTPTAWPFTDLVGKYVFFEFNNYQEGYLITNHTNTSDTIRVRDTENQIPLGDFLWEIRGQSIGDIFKLEAVNIDYTMLGETIDSKVGVV